jgi:tetratricopeptide (TPR) repeat protein
MRHFKSFLPLPVFLCLFLPASAQDARRDSSTSDARELKRSAHRMHIGVEQLKNARQTLREATDLLLRLESVPPHSFSSIGQMWVEIDRSRAGEKLESLFNILRNNAQASTTLETYQRFTEFSQPLLSTIANLDPDKAVQLAREWPEPPKSQDGSAQGTGESLLSQFLKNHLMQIAYREPERALSLLRQQGSSGEPNYFVRGQIANQLSSRGRKEDALKLIDQAISDFRQKPSSGAIQDYGNFLQQIASVDPERFKSGFADLAQYTAQPGPRVSTGTPVRIGNEVVLTTTEEAAILNVFRGVQNRPELALKLLDTVPELKAEIDQFGGIDSFLNPNWNSDGSPRAASSRMLLNNPGVATGRLLPYSSRASQVQDTPMQLMSELRGKTLKNRALVRKRLSEAAGTPEQLQVLLSLAQMANHEDPDLSSLALEIASGLVARVEPLQQRAMMFQNLVQTYRQVEAEVDPSLIKEGFVLADQIREQEEAKVQPGNVQRKGTGLTQADQLEVTLLGEYARDNFDAAIRYVRSMPDNSFKLAVLTQMAQSIRQF